MIFTRRNYFIRYFYNYFSSAENFPVNAQALIDASSKHTPVFVHKSIDRTSPPSVHARQILEETGRVVLSQPIEISENIFALLRLACTYL